MQHLATANTIAVPADAVLPRGHGAVPRAEHPGRSREARRCAGDRSRPDRLRQPLRTPDPRCAPRALPDRRHAPPGRLACRVGAEPRALAGLVRPRRPLHRLAQRRQRDPQAAGGRRTARHPEGAGHHPGDPARRGRVREPRARAARSGPSSHRRARRSSKPSSWQHRRSCCTATDRRSPRSRRRSCRRPAPRRHRFRRRPPHHWRQFRRPQTLQPPKHSRPMARSPRGWTSSATR